MTSVPTYATRPSFLGIERSDPRAAICVAGIPYDLGTSNRPGARFGPAAIRQASRMLVDGDHPVAWAEPADADIADIGDFRIAHGDIAGLAGGDRGAGAAAQASRRAGRRPHDHPCAAARAGGAQRPAWRWCISTRMSIPGRKVSASVYGHGSPFYHAIEEGLIDPRRTVQIGIRSPMDRGGPRLDRRQGRHDPLRRGRCMKRGRRRSPSASARSSATRRPI